MSATTSTYLQIRTRAQYLRGESDTAGDTFINNHIQSSIRDILNSYPFSWNVTTTTLTLSAGTANLPANFNPKWGIKDARIVGSSVSDDNIFTFINIKDRDSYSSTNYVYWLTYDTTSNVFVFNTLTQTGTVTIYYYFYPDDLSADADVCVIPDWEAVAYLAAAKMYVGDERNLQLKTDYEKEAGNRISALYQADLIFGPVSNIGTPVGYNPELTGGGYYSDMKIARS